MSELEDYIRERLAEMYAERMVDEIAKLVAPTGTIYVLWDDGTEFVASDI